MLADMPTGFQLDTGGLRLEFYRADTLARAAALTLPIAFQKSIVRLAYCEVHMIAPLFINPTPNASEQRFLNVLVGLVHQRELDLEHHRLFPYSAGFNPKNVELGRIKLLTRRLPNLISTLHPEPGSEFLEPFWDGPGKAMFRDDRVAYETALISYGETLNDLVDYLRHIKLTNPEITPENLCADPSFGFAK